jgi:hypothetical protein
MLAILLKEKCKSADFMVLDLYQDVKIVHMSCVIIDIDLDVVCNVSLRIRMVTDELHAHSASALFVLSEQTIEGKFQFQCCISR